MDGAFRNDTRLEQLRTPPMSIEAEQAVLGGLMLPVTSLEIQARRWSEVADLVTEESFYRRDHQLIFRALKQLEAKGLPFDCVTVGEFFERHGYGEQVSGGAYLVELASSTPSAANIRAYAEIVADKAKLRGLIEIGTEIVNDGFQPDGRETLEIIGLAQTRVASLLSMEPCDLEAMAPVLVRVFDKLQKRYETGGGEGGITGMATGYGELDRLLNGLSGGQLLILAARPKQGKTTLAQNIAEHFALVHKKGVAVFTFEMKPEEIGDRLLSSVGDIDGDRIRRGDLDDADWANVTSAIRKLRGADIRITRPKAARVEHIIAQVRRAHAKAPLGLVVIDYLQLLTVSGDNRAQGYGDVTRALKNLATELDIPILLLSQLNRDLEKRPDKRPIPSDLRDSGAIEQDADAVIFIYRDEWYHKDSRWKGTAEIIVALQRNGPSGMVRLKYRPDRFRFEPLPEEWEPEPLPEKAPGERGRGFRRAKNVPVPRADVNA
jgi:replicative DNA helicase